ncbi:MAG: ribosome biogenesis GTPase YlqF [Bacilli bacterium]|nr:ribosome biogenesis GTPase YlqF [Bacilli bacterium]MDD4644199.1 ribosome biogenesis GTPase YlqF [Bacilli bacterium]
MEQNQAKTNINWYPGHMAKSKGLIKEKLPLIDVVLEVIDARIPFSSKIRDIDKIVRNKQRILIMTKVDLCDMSETKKWITYYENLGYHVILVDLLNNKNIDLIIKKCKDILSELNNKMKLKGMMKKNLRALIIGIPNVGKSTLINRLVGKKVANVGNRPGVTKSLSWIRIDNSLELLDSPGILWPKFENDKIALNLAAMGAIKEEILPLDDVAIYILTMLDKYYPNALNERYGITNMDTNDIITTLDTIGKRRGAILKGGEIDYNKVYKIIMKDLTDGSLGPITFDRYNEIE